MVGRQSVERLIQAVRQFVDVVVLLGSQLVEVLVNGLAWLDTVANAVDARHEDGREAQVRVGRWVGHAILDALGLR